jgi:hypothetical protein
MTNERTKPYVNTVGDRLCEGFAMHGDEYEDHGGVFEDLDIYYPNGVNEADVLDNREADSEEDHERYVHYQELRDMDDEDLRELEAARNE